MGPISLHHTGTENSEHAQAIRAVIGDLCHFLVPCACVVNFSIISSRHSNGVDLKQRDQIFSLHTFLNRSHVVVVRSIRKVGDVQKNGFEAIEQ